MVEYFGHSEREAVKGFYCDKHGKTGCAWDSVELYEYNLSCVVQDRNKSVGGESPDLPREIIVAEFYKICFQVSETTDVR